MYGLHRLALRLEERGFIYYLNKKPRSSPMGSFVAFQRVLEPRAEHVIQVTRVNHLGGEDGASGADPGDTPDAPPSVCFR